MNNKPDAVVFIPGIEAPWEGGITEGFGDRMVAAFERNPTVQGQLSKSVESDHSLELFGGDRFIKVKH